MSKLLERRIAKLEAKNRIDDRIPIYVRLRGKDQDIEADVRQRIDELIGLGALNEEDRPRCVFWLHYRPYGKWMVEEELKRRLNRQAAMGSPEWLQKKAQKAGNENRDFQSNSETPSPEPRCQSDETQRHDAESIHPEPQQPEQQNAEHDPIDHGRIPPACIN